MTPERPGLHPGAPTREQREEAIRRELQRIIPLLADLGAQRVILFGSAARERIRATSDLDLIVVMETDAPFVERVQRIREAIAPRLSCDVLVYTPEEFEEMTQSSLLVRQALREGEVLHEARSDG
ncbi:MAG: nucleotidyltransferase domain-containing protein [Armatimonadota bacterium]|nr:nucleotidyltransferase domain-containing protein [Armatimonadota bacterium]